VVARRQSREDETVLICHRFGLAVLLTLAAGTVAAADEVRGTVTKVDPAKNELILDARGRGTRGLSMMFSLTKESRIQAGRQTVELSDLQPGTRVQVQYETQNGQRVALGISVRGALTKKPQTKPAPGAVDANTVAGTIHRIIFTEREVVVRSLGAQKDKPAETTVLVPETAAITKDGKVLTLDNLKEGDQVVMRVEQRDGKVTAASVQLGVPPSPNVDRAQQIEQFRLYLKLADLFLQQMARRQANPTP
jgi:Cu/Ag efflux protein CusF